MKHVRSFSTLRLLSRNLLIGGSAIAIGVMMLSGCSDGVSGYSKDSTRQENMMSYSVRRLSEPMQIDGNWDKPQWQNADPLRLSHYMGERPSHFPQVQAKLLYDEQAIYVIFRVEDQYVRAVAAEHQGPVCRDSCVEFFFTPGEAVSAGYFNLEMNCGGTMLLHFQVIPRQNSVPITPTDLEKIEVAHSLPRLIDPEIVAPTTWTVEYRLPIEIFSHYFPEMKPPAPDVIWRANFYKCADATSHPHWLTWAPVHHVKPDFHRPNEFGQIIFR